MRMLTASVALIALVLLQGCATLQRYPSFGTSAGGRLILYDRTTHPATATEAGHVR